MPNYNTLGAIQSGFFSKSKYFEVSSPFEDFFDWLLTALPPGLQQSTCTIDGGNAVYYYEEGRAGLGVMTTFPLSTTRP